MMLAAAFAMLVHTAAAGTTTLPTLPTLPAASSSSPVPPPSTPAPSAGYFPNPRVHITPPCYDHQGGWHDIAGALLHPVTSHWHVFVGPIWQHVFSSNLVDWTISASGLKGMGGSGTLIYDTHRNLTVALTGIESIILLLIQLKQNS